MSYETLLEELEVLESIYPAELSKLSERDIQIDAEPDDPLDGGEELRLTLCVHYTEEYPDRVPDMTLRAVEGQVDDQELQSLLLELRKVGTENLGMAMTFTLVSHLREVLSHLVRARVEKRRQEDMERERLVLEEEEARTRGTPVTLESFKIWKVKSDHEFAMKKAREEEEKLKGLTPKEREEWKKIGMRPSGRQLFERGGKNLEDDTLLEEGTVSVDISQYERARVEEEPDEGVTFSDSD
ncbi:RWD domain-containing protein [Tricholoma matsutake]|nr:RWD domain-containing protein [Tricholoma matsutake 945]